MPIATKEVIKRFYDENRKYARATNGNSMYFETRADGTRVLYSYGPHFPLVVLRGGKAFVNRDKYSITTSKAQGMCFPHDWHTGGRYEIVKTDTAGCRDQIA